MEPRCCDVFGVSSTVGLDHEILIERSIRRAGHGNLPCKTGNGIGHGYGRAVWSPCARLGRGLGDKFVVRSRE